MNETALLFLRRAVGGALVVWFPLLVWNAYYALYVYYGICLLGIGFLLTGGWSRADRNSRRLWWATIGVIATTILTLLAVHTSFLGWRNFETVHVKLLGVIPIAIVLRELRPSQAYLWWGIALGASLTGIVSLLEIQQQTGESFGTFFNSFYRVTGGEHPVIFGMVCSALVVLTLSGGIYFVRLGPAGVVVWIASILLSVGACLLTESRGALVAILAAVFLLAYFRLRTYWQGGLSWGTAIAGVVLCSLVLYQFPRVQERIAEGYHDTKGYFSRASGESVQGSLGQRFEMWKASFQIFLEHPLVGVGLGPQGYPAQVQKLISEGQSDPSIGQYGHPHNQYLSLLASRGIIGAVAFGLFSIFLFQLYWRALRLEKDARPIALAGIIVTTAYLLFGVSEVPLEHKRVMLLFVFATGVLSGMASPRAERERADLCEESPTSRRS